MMRLRNAAWLDPLRSHEHDLCAIQEQNEYQRPGGKDSFFVFSEAVPPCDLIVDMAPILIRKTIDHKSSRRKPNLFPMALESVVLHLGTDWDYELM